MNSKIQHSPKVEKGQTADSKNSEVKQQTNLQTGRIFWIELQPHFARGSVVVIDGGLDLVDIASAFIEDESERIFKLMETEKLRKPAISDAERWHEAEQEFWAIVVAPWVLVQEV